MGRCSSKTISYLIAKRSKSHQEGAFMSASKRTEKRCDFFPPAEVYSIAEWYANASDKTTLFADGKEVKSTIDEGECLVGLELRILLSPCDWCRFQEQPFYLDLLQYLDNLKTLKESTRPVEEKD